MLSSELPSGPSCSSKSAGPGVRGRAYPATSAAEAPMCHDPRDLVQPFPKFSIRDYALASRSKGVKKSWPFHPTSLQLCLKRGVKDPLPPFQPPDLIPSPPFDSVTNIEHSVVHSEAIACVGLVKTRGAGSLNIDTSDINFQSSQPVDESSLGPSPCTSPEDGKSGIDQVGSTNESDHTDGLIHRDLQDNSWTNASRQTEVARSTWRSKNLASSCETSQKKCKFVVKLGTPDIQRTEDMTSNSSSVSDPIASKTCPVCKVFASSSNTTLNAHIDQCLSVETNSELAETVPVKSKVKAKKNNTVSAHIDHCPSVESNTQIVDKVLVKHKVKAKKKRLMVDIYKTALPYTLGDLDKKNGINWATDLATPMVNNEVCTENRSPEVLPFDTRDDEREADVYVDSNGIKIRILSKSSAAPSVQNAELGTKKFPSHEIGKGVLMRKKILKAKMLKNKLNMDGKKYNKRCHLNSQVQAHPNGRIEEETTAGELHARNPTEITSHDGSGTMRMSYKRSDISKNVSRKLRDKTFDKVASGAQRLTRSGRLGLVSSRVPESHIGALFVQQPDEMGTTSEANGVEQSNESSRFLRLSSKIPLQNSVLPRVPRSAAAVAKRKIREIGMREANKSENYDIIKNSNSMKRSGAWSSFSAAGPSNGPSGVTSTFKKFQKQRSLLRTGRRTCSSSDSKLVNGCDQDKEPDTRYASKKLRRSSTLKFVKHTEEDSADYDFSFGGDMPLSGQQDKQYDAAQQKDGTQMDYEGEEPETDNPYASVSRNDPAALLDNSSITSTRDDSNQEHGLPFRQDSLDSPLSTASTMSPTPLKYSRTKESEPGPSTIQTIEERITGSLNKETMSMPIVRESEELPNAKPCCCSCRGSISRESQLQHQSEAARPMLNFAGKQVPQLHIGLTASSSFSTYQRTTTKANTVLNSHDQPLAAKVSTETSVNLPSYITDCKLPSLQTQLPSPSNPVLRLMGKNLMVMNNEESAHPPAPSSDYILRRNYVEPVGFLPPNYHLSNDSAFMNMTPEAANRQIPPPNVQAGSFAGPSLHSNSMMQSDYYSQQKSYRNLVPVTRHPTYMMKEVIVIDDDSPERRNETQVSMLHHTAPSPATTSVPNTRTARPFYCLPSHPILPRERAAGSLPVFANAGSRVGVNSSSNQGSQTEAANPYIQNPFLVRSQTGCINPSVYSSQNLR